MSSELLKGAIETRVTVNPAKLSEVMKGQGWTAGAQQTATVVEWARGAERVLVLHVGDSVRLAKPAGDTGTKLSRLIGPKKERKPRTPKSKK